MNRVTAIAAGCGAFLIACAATTTEASDDQAVDQGYGLEAIAFGLLYHDAGIFGHRKEAGADFNAELRFDKLTGEFWGIFLNPQPHLGMSINSDGGTDQAYFGLTWLFDLGAGFFAGGSLGGAVHDGSNDTLASDRKSLGSRILFRESAELGFRFMSRHSLSLMLDHISNAGLADPNEGLDNVEIRYALHL